MGLIRRLRKCTQGIAAIEFGLIMPILLSMLLGLVELERLTAASRRAMSTAQNVADLVAQDSTHTDASLGAIATAARLIMDPLPSDATVMSISVYSVGFDRYGNPMVLWQHNISGAVPLNLGDTRTLGDGKESVIGVALTYTYNSPFGYTFGTRTVSEQAFARPRIATRIALNGQTEQ